MELKKVIRFNYKNLSNEVHKRYNELIDATILKHNPVNLKIESLYSRYHSSYLAEIAVLDLCFKSELTEEIAEQDLSRDNTFYGFKKSIGAALAHYDPEIRRRAGKIEFTLDIHGNIARKNYEKETAAIDKLTEELRANRMDDIEFLDLEPWVDLLEHENQKFKDLVLNRFDEKAELPDLRMTNARKAVDELLRAILNYVEAAFVATEDVVLGGFCRDINVISTDFKNKLAQHQGRLKAKAAKKDDKKTGGQDDKGTDGQNDKETDGQGGDDVPEPNENVNTGI